MYKVLTALLLVVSVSVLLSSQDAFAATFTFSDVATAGEPEDIKSMVLLVASVGTDIAIFGLVGVTIAGVAVQAVWFVHKRKKNNS